MLDTIVPSGVAAVEMLGEEPDAALLPEEERALGKVADGRRREFTAARVCARRALAALGVSPVPILPGARRQPLWPDGVIGSITHCDGYCAAAVARRGRLDCIGIDAEVHQPLPEGVLDLVARPSERAWLQTRTDRHVHWDRVLFSAKESVYKAWFPIAGRWLGFEDALLTLDPGSGRLRARLLVDGPCVNGRVVAGFDGRFLVQDGLVVTAVSAVRWASP